LREKTQIGAGGTLTIASLLAVMAQITGHLKAIAENVPFLKSLPPAYLAAGLAILLLAGLALLWRGLFAGLRPPDPRRLVVDPEKNPDQFVGRKADLESLAQCLDEGQLVFLTGESGSGKSVLVKVGLRDCLTNDRRDLNLLPIVMSSYGASEDWDADLAARLASRFFDSLTAEERARLSYSERKRTTRELMDLLRACESKIGRIPLLIFDQFDDYQNLHRSQFLRDRKWITPEILVMENRFWKAIREALETRILKVLLVTRQDRFVSLESMRLVRPVIYPLPGIVSTEIGALLGDLLAGAGLTGLDLETLKKCLLDDLADGEGSVLPIQAALAFQGLASLDYLTPRHYRRKGGLRGLQLAHVRRGMLHFAHLLGIDRRTACAFFRCMVDNGSPPKTIAVPSSVLASQVARQEREVVESLQALAKPAFRLVRERIEAADTYGPEWSLYHDFLAPIVLEVQRQLDFANALLEQKHGAFRSANGWWPRWTALLSAWESLRLAWAAVRRQLRTHGHRRYLLASTIRLLPAIAILCLASWFKLALRDQRARAEAQKVVSAISAVSDLSQPPAGGELERIVHLARAKWPVKEQFIRDLLQFPMTPDRFVKREKYLTHAIVGIDPLQRTRRKFLTVLATAPLGKGPDSLATRGLWRARVFASDPAGFAPEAEQACADLVEAMQAMAMTGSFELRSLVPVLKGLAEKIDPKLSVPLAEKVVNAMRATTCYYQIGPLAEGLAVLAENVDTRLSAQGAEKVVEVMRAATYPSQFPALAQGLAGLAEKIDPKLVVQGAEEIVEAVRTTSDFDGLEYLAQGLAVLAVKIDPKLCTPLAEKIAEAMQATSDPDTLMQLAHCLASVIGEIDFKLSALLAEKIVEAIRTTGYPDRLFLSYNGLAVLAARIDAEDCVPLAEKIVEAIRTMSDLDGLRYLSQALSVLAGKIDPRLSASLAEKLVEAMRPTGDPAQLSHLAEGLVILAGKIDPKLSAQAAERIVEAMRATGDPFQLRYLAGGLVILAGKIDPKLSAQAAERIVEAMRATSDPAQLQCLAQGLAVLAEKVDAELIVRGAEKLVTAMQAASDPAQLSSLALGLAVLAEKVDAELIVRGAEKLVTAMQAASDPAQLSSLAQGLAVLAEKVDAELTVQGAEKLVTAMRAASRADELHALAEGLAGLAEKVDAELSAQGAEEIVEAIRARAGPDNLSMLAQGLAGLAGNIDAKLSVPLAEKVVKAMQATSDPYRLRYLAEGLFCLKQVDSVENPQVVVDLLKQPLAVMPVQFRLRLDDPTETRHQPSVMGSLLAYLGRGLRKEPFPDLEAFVDWANAHPEIGLDLETPPEL